MRRLHRSKSIVVAAVGVALGWVAPGEAKAGNDTARINPDGTLDFSVHYAYPPTQAELDRMESIIRNASVHMCDATDGQLRFGEVTIASASSSEATADVWILPPGLWNRSSSTGFVLEDAARVFITPSGRDGPTFAHEMMHAALQLLDAYDEQNRGGGYEGIGWAIDPGVCAAGRNPCVEDGDCLGIDTCDRDHLGVAAPYVDASANTIMSSLFADSLRPRCTDLTVNPPVVSNLCLGGDIDCTAPSRCVPSPYYSEILTSAVYDAFVGDGGPCPAPNPGSQVRLRGLLSPDVPQVPLDTTDLVTAFFSGLPTAVLPLVDEVGELVGERVASDHRLYVFAEHLDPATSTWRLHFALDGYDVDGSVPLAYEPVGTVDIDFNGPVANDPFFGDATGTIRVWNGSSFETPSSPNYVQPVLQTPTFSTGASPADLQIDLDELFSTEPGQFSNLTGSELLGANGLPQTGSCLASYPPDGMGGVQGFCDGTPNTNVCATAWNAGKGRWEAAQQTRLNATGLNIPFETGYDSEWDLVADLPNRYGPAQVSLQEDQFRAPIVAPVGDPDEDSVNCIDVGDDVQFDTRIGFSDALVLLIDTSGSMSTPLDNFGQSLTRHAWAVSAAWQVAGLVEQNNVAGNAPVQELGVVTFATQDDSLLPLSALGTANEPSAGDVRDLLLATSPVGVTAFADGLQAATAMATSGAAAAPSVVAFTDGQANACLGGAPAGGPNCSLDEAAEDALDVVDQAAQGDPSVTTYFVPLGAQLGVGVFGEAAAAPGDIMIADTGYELPMTFLEAYLRSTGRSPIAPRQSWAVAGTTGRPSDLRRRARLPLTVEADAGALHISLSALNRDTETFEPEFVVRRPDGTPLSSGDYSVMTDDVNNIFRSIIVRNPEPGGWVLELESGTEIPQYGYALAWTEGAAADCYAGTSNAVVRDGQASQRISAVATWEVPVEQVDHVATLYRPDGTFSSYGLQPGATTPGRSTSTIPAPEHRGLYRVEVACDATQSRFVPGEVPSDPRADFEPDLVRRTAPPFVRTATTTFVVDSDRYQPLPPGDDCDGDGRTNAEEGAFCENGNSTGRCEVAPTSQDTDGNGVLDACDPDNDADDIPDADEPDGDPDGDGVPNPFDPDSDGDGIIDGIDLDPYTADDPSVRCERSRGLLVRASLATALHHYDMAAQVTRQSMYLEDQLVLQLDASEPEAALALQLALQFEAIALHNVTLLAGSDGSDGYLLELYRRKVALLSLATAIGIKSTTCPSC